MIAIKRSSISSIVTISVLFLTSISSASALSLYRQLEIGMSGQDVRELQTYLASNPSIYPQGIASGYFGYLTQMAVRRFQALAGIAQVGRVGPQTMAALNSGNFINSPTNTNTSAAAPLIRNVVTTSLPGSATINWTTDEAATGKIFFSTAPLQVYETWTDAIVTGAQVASQDNTYKNSQSLTIPNLARNTTYYYMIYVVDQNGNVSVTDPRNVFRTN
jgi:peptidoglycan hydrolase-like protein with peptidoglycan-binding domain